MSSLSYGRMPAVHRNGCRPFLGTDRWAVCRSSQPLRSPIRPSCQLTSFPIVRGTRATGRTETCTGLPGDHSARFGMTRSVFPTVIPHGSDPFARIRPVPTEAYPSARGRASGLCHPDPASTKHADPVARRRRTDRSDTSAVAYRFEHAFPLPARQRETSPFAAAHRFGQALPWTD